MNVYYGTNDNAHLSNLYDRPFILKGRHYKSVEHAYQCLKSGVFDEANYIKGKDNVRIVGKLGTNVTNNWNISLMHMLMLESFKQNKESAIWLKLTGDVPFTHREDNGIWREQFPILLEKVRAELEV